MEWGGGGPRSGSLYFYEKLGVTNPNAKLTFIIYKKKTSVGYI